jgi:predicted esterase
MKNNSYLSIILTVFISSACNKGGGTNTAPETIFPVEVSNVYDLAVSGSIKAGTDKVLTLPLNYLSLSGVADNVSETTSFQWVKVSGPEATISTPSSLSTKISNLTEGQYLFQITRTDGSEKVSDSVSVTVKPAPRAADANAGKISLWKNSSAYDSAVFLPADYGVDPNKLYPLIISLHGLNGSVLNTAHTAVGGSKTGFIKQVWGTSLAKTYPAIVVAPNWSPVGSTSSGLWTHLKLRTLILNAIEKYSVDRNKIVATGLSAGSIATQELVRNSKDLLAGAMPGAYAPVNSDACTLADIPVWVFGNSSDALFNQSSWSSYSKKVTNCSNYDHNYELTIYQSTCGHGCWDSHWAKPEVQDWLINQSK